MEEKTLSWEKLYRRIGLSDYEAKVYISLAMEGPSEARKLSMTTNVPRTKIYGTLKKLIERGLIVETPEEPRRFAVTSPAEAFKTFLQSLKNELGEGVTSLVESETAISLLEEIHKKRQLLKTTGLQMGDVWFTQGRRETLRKTGEMLSKAKNTVNVVTTENGLILFYKAFNRLLDRLVENNVKIRIRAPVETLSKNLIHELRYAYEIKHERITIPMLFVCIDKSELFLAELNPNDFNPESGQDCGFFSQNRTLCTLFSSLFGSDRKIENQNVA